MMKDRDERLEERFAERDEILEERQSEIYDRLVPAINDVISDLREFKEGFEEQNLRQRERVNQLSEFSHHLRRDYEQQTRFLQDNGCDAWQGGDKWIDSR